MDNSALKIALVKQDVYQDLYVVPTKDKNVANILFSSQGRVGPIALISELDADFYIVEEESDKETQLYRKVIPHLADNVQLLKTQTLDKLPGQEFKEPGSSTPQGEYAISCYDIDWKQYDIVISINISLPTKLILKYPNTLFAYMIGEANIATSTPYFGYDIVLNQMARGYIATELGVVDFPYTFLKGNTLKSIIEKGLNLPDSKEGVFMEINSTTERPVTKTPDHFEPLENLGFTIKHHKQNIKNNLQEIYNSKYFLKMGGRVIRGNSLAEAISLGTLVMMDKDQLIHQELLNDECDVKTMDEAIHLIQRLESDKEYYDLLLSKQIDNLNKYFYDAPLQSLVNCLDAKRKKGAKSLLKVKFENLKRKISGASF